MKVGNTAILIEDGTETPATIVAVNSVGDVPEPKILDLQVGDAVTKNVLHRSVAAPGAPCWITAAEHAAVQAK